MNSTQPSMCASSTATRAGRRRAPARQSRRRRCSAAAASPRKQSGDHQVAQVAVEGAGVRRHQLARAAGRDQRLVELAVVALPELGLARRPPSIRALDHARACGGRRRRGPPTRRRRRRRTAPSAWLSSSSRSSASSRRFCARHRRHLEAALALGQHQPLGGEPAQDLPQRADADAVLGLHPVEPQLRAGRDPPEDDVGADALVGVLADRERDDLCADVTFTAWLLRILVRCAIGSIRCIRITPLDCNVASVQQIGAGEGRKPANQGGSTR